MSDIIVKKNDNTTERVVKNIPSSENGAGVLCKTTSGQRYQISQNTEKKKFTLWKVVENGFIKIKTANSPLELEELVPWDK